MDTTTAWSEGHMPSFEIGEQGEDWEDWLRWDPAAEPTSPEDGTFHSGSSKNDSPIQDPALPAMDSGLFGKSAVNDTLAPPLIMGEDGLDFGLGRVPDDETFMFGASANAGSSDFNFDTDTNSFQPATHAGDSKVDANTGWALPSNAPAPDVDLTTLLHANNHQPFQTAGSSTSGLTPPGIQNHSSPASTSQNRTSVSSHSPASANNPPKKRGGRKRKAETQITKDEDQNNSNGDSGADGEDPPTKTSHNVIEKRYRNNLNDKIVELRNSVPSLRAMGRTNGGEDNEDLEGLTPAHKLNKATVMAKATEYIKHLEKRNKTMADEMAGLQSRLAAVEAAIGSNRDRTSSGQNSPSNTNGSVRSRQTSSGSLNGSQAQQTYLSVPQEQNHYLTQQQQQAAVQQQQQYMQQQQQPVYARPPHDPAHAQHQQQHQQQYVYGRGGGVMNKVMMGAMAGIMVMEGFSEQQSDDSKQLGAMPGLGHLFKRDTAISSSSPAALTRQALVPMVKVLCIVGALMYILAPLLTWTPKKNKKTHPVVRLPQAPSLASPVEVRRKAWLTAVQTVYVPKHFLLEVAAVTSKMVKLSLRRLIGSETWNALTGTNKEEEAARTKAWDIAIDAQLAGGDQEVSYYRLLLTLMASGTLPDSPTRLMQKAVHFRVFFWEVANAGYGNMSGFKSFTENVGRIYWDSARRQQRELVHAKAQGRPTAEDGVEVLPDHLAALLELECDDVLSDEMIQRAWNLAWNKRSAYNTSGNAARDAVVEDHAIRSPLDAVAAWYANMTIDDSLLDAFGESPSQYDMEYYIGLAVSIAPPASATHVRALAAKAVLSNVNRENNVLAALEALPVANAAECSTMNVVEHAPAPPEIGLALTMAKLFSLLSSSAPPSAQARAYTAIPNLRLQPSNITLLTAVAVYRLIRTTGRERRIPVHTAHGLEEMAASLRLWIGTSAGRKAGLEHDDCGRVVEVCLNIAKRFGGWDEKDRDSGYGGSPGCSPVRERSEVGTGLVV
ncbi:hypothetical protein KC363_g6327 [Hortaea werneckii]|nr:hypothetical protein KC363_g6327 [Hortaea werneckii]